MISVLNDDEFSARLHEARSFLLGLKAEADARKLLSLATSLAYAQESLGEAVRLWQAARQVLEPWQFVNSAGLVVECSWCNSEHGHAPEAVSHGICPRHLAAMRADLERRRAA